MDMRCCARYTWTALGLSERIFAGAASHGQAFLLRVWSLASQENEVVREAIPGENPQILMFP